MIYVTNVLLIIKRNLAISVKKSLKLSKRYKCVISLWKARTAFDSDTATDSGTHSVLSWVDASPSSVATKKPNSLLA